MLRMYLMNLPLSAKVLDNRQYFCGRILQSRRRGSQIQLETIIRSVDNRFVTLNGFENRRRVPLVDSLLPTQTGAPVDRTDDMPFARHFLWRQE